MLIDVSRLKEPALSTKGFDSVQVDAVLKGLYHATNLETLRLDGSNVTGKQKERMRAKSVTLKNRWSVKEVRICSLLPAINR